MEYAKETNRIDGETVSVLACSALGRGFEPLSGQTKDYNIGFDFFLYLTPCSTIFQLYHGDYAELEHYGILGNINRWITSFLYNRTQAVVVDGDSSTHIDVDSGVPQDPYLGHHYSYFTSTTCLRK